MRAPGGRRARERRTLLDEYAARGTRRRVTGRTRGRAIGGRIVMRSDRRTFVKRLALASAAGAAASLMPGIVFGGDVDRAVEGLATPVWRKTPCRFCGVGCGLLVAIENGRAVAVRGDPDSPVNRGLACVKGYHSVQMLYGRDRITRAMVRRNGRLVEVPMEEALDLVAQRIRETIDRHGKDAVAMYGSGQWTIPAGYVASKLFK